MKAKELKRAYIEFFKSKGHAEIKSAPLIPQNDPTVLFTTAGMHPLVPFLMGQKHPSGTRLVDVQKCLRTQDIDEVGDNTHTTFFEMLGNWSLGDYFKKEAIEMSFEFLTKVLKIDTKRFAVTVYQGDSTVSKDEESAQIWMSLGIKPERIAFLPKEDNWWGPAGETGPCGPDTEMFYWVGDKKAPSKFDPKDKKWVEIWNDVFMQYNKQKDGSYAELSQKNVDTGLGVERVTMLMQGKSTIFETELFMPIINKIEELSGKKYDVNLREFRIISDHIRASTFILGDEIGVAPSNKDQGYVLRRYIRRTVRLGNQLGMKQGFCKELAKEVIGIYSEEYPILSAKKETIFKELETEENKFMNTLAKGIKEFEKICSGKKNLEAKDAFLLLQSYGFPVEMTCELAKEKGICIDSEACKEEFRKHQELSRKGAEQKFKGGLADSSEMTVKLHTATHLLNEALREVLGPKVKQKGSNITPERLRFDFNFDRKMTDEEIKKVENIVNDKIKESIDVRREEMTVDEAKAKGAQAEFEYDHKVSVYFIGDFSKEICMGPHASNTSELGHFKILKEESSAAGVRRIKAVLE